MEMIQFSFFQFCFNFLILLLVAVKIVQCFRTKSSKPKLPPGPRKLPIIGNMNQFLNSLPHRRLRDLSNVYGPLMHLKLGQISTIVVSSPEAAEEVMKTHDVNFASRPFLLAADIVAYGATDVIFSPYGNYWRHLRRIFINELLSPKRVLSFRSIREEEVSNLVRLISEKAREGSIVNVSKEMISWTFSITSRAAFGRKFKDQEEFISLVEEGLEFTGGFLVADVFPSLKFLHHLTGTRGKLERIHRGIDRILENIINEHLSVKEEKRNGVDIDDYEKDLVDVLLNLQKSGDLEFPITNDNIKAIIVDVFSAGTETSTTTVEWAMSEMLRNPRILENAQIEVRKVFDPKGNVEETRLDELHYLKSIIKETLRLHPPAPLLLPRECRKTCEIFGYEMPVGTKAIVNAWAIGRDPKYWSEPERFYPERFLDSPIGYKGNSFEYIPFGAGRRMCPGISFAVPNVELPLACLLYYFDWKLSNGAKEEDLDMSEVFGAAVTRKNDLCLIPSLYNPIPIKED